MWHARRFSGRAQRLLSRGAAGLTLAALLVLAGCNMAPFKGFPTPAPAATFVPLPTPTATRPPPVQPTPIAPPTPKPIPTPAPTAAPPSACMPGLGVQPVSATVIRSVATTRMQVSLTFDSNGGPAGNATTYLNILRAHQIRTTWFLTGDFARANPAIVRQIRADGHDIGNHTVDHPDLTSPARSDSFICSEITRADQMIAAASGRTTRPFFRPPNGDYNDQVRTLAAQLGYRTITWNIDPADWNSTHTAQYIENNILNSPNLKPGAIILMHVNSAHEAEALDTVIVGIERRGYTVVPLSQLLG